MSTGSAAARIAATCSLMVFRLDSYKQFLAVEESTYQLIAQVDRAPITRFEYERGAASKPPP